MYFFREMAEKISFCTTCMGRRHHLEKTYAGNLMAAQSYPAVEFVLLDYHSPDGLTDWVRSELREWMDGGVVRYFRTEEPRQFHMAHAKNMAHRLATGAILVNLDADNFFSAGYCEELAALFRDQHRMLGGFADFQRGSMGRIAVRREEFEELGGYNEDFTGWGYEDADLMERALASGFRLEYFDPRHAGAIQHRNRERTRFTEEKRIKRNNHRNHLRSLADIAAGRWVANAGREWGRATILSSDDTAKAALRA